MDSSTALRAPIIAPAEDCGFCPRLHAHRAALAEANPAWRNAPVASLGPDSAAILIVGPPPALDGANRTGAALAADPGGAILMRLLTRLGLAREPAVPTDIRLTHAVRCPPPAALALPAEISACNRFLRSEVQAMANLGAVLALGAVAHSAVLKACGLAAPRFPFRPGEIHLLPDGLLLANVPPMRADSDDHALESILLKLTARLAAS